MRLGCSTSADAARRPEEIPPLVFDGQTVLFQNLCVVIRAIGLRGWADRSVLPVRKAGPSAESPGGAEVNRASENTQHVFQRSWPDRRQ